ncbi:expansin EXLX1 family cellulose-binding protein [Polymorphospora sp. NPDC051019]|uniref:expansin EXLX1 family cellulose-binding protein n=1 Tax=Polymorphospora sp. NPDC051019 TaxID=3155725 RepID=UPI0034311EBC
MSERTIRGHRRVPRRPYARWLAAGGLTVVAAVAGLAVLLQTGVPAACAVPTTAQNGKATFYDSNGGGGNCSHVGPPATRMYVALGPTEYDDAAACGSYLDVTGPKGKVRVMVMDQCPECPPGHIDLSRQAFAKIADPVQGVVPVTYRRVVDPALPGPLAFRIKDGASQWWFAVLVTNHGNPLNKVEARPPGGGWKSAVRQDYNYWIIEGGLGPGPYTIRVTDDRGRQAVAEGIRMAPEQTQQTNISMYGAPARPTAASPSRPPTPTAEPSPTVEPTATVEPTPTAVAASEDVPTAPAASGSATPATCH